jgi:hypothetical protein
VYPSDANTYCTSFFGKNVVPMSQKQWNERDGILIGSIFPFV